MANTDPIRVDIRGTGPLRSNVLHDYNSFNYLFTLSAVTPAELKDPNLIRDNPESFIIAKSAGKIKDSINPTAAGNPLLKPLIQDFNKTSSGRFDLFINNVEINTIMAFSPSNNTTMATKVSFEIFEPYSMNGFMEALQVSALAAGFNTYLNAPFLLKVEFIGYKSSADVSFPKLTKVGKNGTRYFVINITRCEFESAENGTKYRVSAIAHNETSFGDHNNLKETYQLVGTTVGQLLKSFEQSLNEASKDAAKSEQTKDDVNLLYDTYEIVIPSPTSSGFDYKTTYKKIADAPISETLTSPANWAFADPGETAVKNFDKSAGNSVKFTTTVNSKDPCVNSITGDAKTPTKINTDNVSEHAVYARSGESIQNVISNIVRDGYGKTLLKLKIENVLKDQLVEYFHVGVETELGKWNPRTRRHVVHHRYVVFPHLIHYSRIPLFQKAMSDHDLSYLKDLCILREYYYFYTGKNVDIRNFSIKYNNLFYQGYPRGMGNHTTLDNNARSSDDRSGKQLGGVSEDYSKNLLIPDAVRLPDPAQNAIVPLNGTAGKRDYYTFDALVVNMHEAILRNTDMIKLDIEILGDPYYLVTGGIGNYRPRNNGMAASIDNEALYQSIDVLIYLEFRNPDDINPKTGSMIFNKSKAAVSGVYRVLRVQNIFNDGMFTQRLSLLRLPGQPANLVGDSSRYKDLKTSLVSDVDVLNGGLTATA